MTCVYSCITGGYDHAQPIATPGIPHLLYTDNLSIHAPGWEVLPLPSNWEGYPPQVKARFAKWLPHQLLPEQYDYSLWQDGNLLQLEDVSGLFDTVLDFAISPHPDRDCAWDELEACRRLKKDVPQNLDDIEFLYEDNNVPRNNGMYASGILLRKHNSPTCVELCSRVAFFVHMICIRDQLALPLVDVSKIVTFDMFNLYKKTRHVKAKQHDSQKHQDAS